MCVGVFVFFQKMCVGVFVCVYVCMLVQDQTVVQLQLPKQLGTLLQKNNKIIFIFVRTVVKNDLWPTVSDKSMVLLCEGKQKLCLAPAMKWSRVYGRSGSAACH